MTTGEVPGGMTDPSGRRRAGLLIPLFSCASTAGWGIGEIGDIPAMTAWLSAAGQRILQVLPLNEMAPGQSSPYSAISAMAIDPIFISLRAVPEFETLGGETSLDAGERERLDGVRRATRIDHASVRHLKNASLQRAFDRFVEAEWALDTGRARALRSFVREQAWWIEDYALFRALHRREGERPWMEWPADLQRRAPSAIDRARRDLWREILYWQYLQWLANTQWRDARADAHGVQLFGDLPFMVDGDSADVWARQRQFRLDASVGAPPDAFSATGQEWGMPLYRWDVIAADDFRWLRDRGRRSADLYDGYRVDHLVGFYRTYGRPKGGAAFFTPAGEPEQLALGERLLEVFREGGAEIIAEDLGTVPDFVRASLNRLRVPGFRVFRWEREWHVEGQPFRDPADYPAVSVAASGTHDTEPLVVWWESASEADRSEVSALPTILRVTGAVSGPIGRSGPAVSSGTSMLSGPAALDAIVEALFASGSDVLLLPVQDVFGWRDRINEPATVSADNWTFKLPWPCDRLDDVPEARARQSTLRAWSELHRRT
jgi:4-alpha-glucanotransferase